MSESFQDLKANFLVYNAKYIAIIVYERSSVLLNKEDKTCR